MSFENDPDRAYAMRLTAPEPAPTLPEGPPTSSRTKAPFLVVLSGTDSDRVRAADYEWSR